MEHGQGAQRNGQWSPPVPPAAPDAGAGRPPDTATAGRTAEAAEFTDITDIAEQLRSLTRAQQRLHSLLDAVLAISRELELPVVLHRIVTTAMELVDARYGALGVLDESGERLEQFIPVGLSEEEEAALAGVELPRGHGLLGHLIHNPEPLRVEHIGAHPNSSGFPPGHPPMRTLLGVAISVRGEIYGDLYLTDRRDGLPFDAQDENIVVALAGAAGVAIENARLFEQVRSGAESFQRLLLPRLPDLHPFSGSAVYRPATAPGQLGGDWYDVILLPDRSCAAVIGDVVGHDLMAAASMAQTRNMLRALLYDRRTPPSLVLSQLDRTLHAITESPVTTACLARIEPEGDGWCLHWSTAGHLPPLVITPDRKAIYLHADPGVPLGVDTRQPRPDHTHPLPGGTTVVFFTDGLVEHPRRPLDVCMDELAEIAVAHAGEPPDKLCRILADNHTSDGHDDLAVLVLRTPDAPA
ncbi:PP2C family protein-serine/threonine phosphatase [Streptomyces radiopugnans]|uniref:GAF domain-containing protein n=1 Tax=Streptomyces radiopugnans TaxID=403935 RepID=A0A1H9CUE9_9ACTN|nr:GAF domain-containing SpoIIE family protein phosphatase [Streptomyces radiopugnans]SEQ04779.1 GAF domain-containing protein [Streptomyces radiopugnans]